MLGYAGAWGYEEDASGLKLLGHRWYDSFSGRFLTRDPAQDGSNWYSYCESNPLDYLDPFGFSVVGDNAARRATDRIGKGPKDCGRWMRGNFPNRAMPPGVANSWAAWFADDPDEWEEVPNDGRHIIQKGDVVITTAPKRKHKKQGHGHVEIIDSKGLRTSASLGERSGKHVGTWRPGLPVSDISRRRRGEVTIWRPKDRRN